MAAGEDLYRYKKENAYTDSFLNHVNPYIRLAWYHTMTPHMYLSERIIYDYEIILVKEGTATITVEEQVYEAMAGDIFFLRPNQRHSIRVHDKPFVQPHIHFDLHYSDSDSAEVPISFKDRENMNEAELGWIRPDETGLFFDKFPVYIHLKDTLYVEQLMFEVISAYVSPAGFPEIRLKWCFLRLLEQLLREVSWQYTEYRQEKQRRAEGIRQYLDYHTERRLTLDELARIHHIDKSYVSRIFREVYHITPMRYHLIQRVEKAKAMMRYTNISLSVIAEQTGFSSQQDFSRAFRNVTGVVPSVFRRMGNSEKVPEGRATS